MNLQGETQFPWLWVCGCERHIGWYETETSPEPWRTYCNPSIAILPPLERWTR